MDLTRSAAAAAAKPAHSVLTPENDPRIDLRPRDRVAATPAAAASAEAVHRSSGYGLPCAKCHLYYPADLDSCPICSARERVSPNVVPAVTTSQATAEPVPDDDVVEQEREAFLKEFKSQLFAAHAEVANSPVACSLGDHEEPATICKACYDRLQERVDVLEAALHMDVKDAAQIVYDAVWADPSDPSKTYTNAAGALLTELRRRSGVSGLIGPFQPLGN